jgi:HlyD family secretion protein
MFQIKKPYIKLIRTNSILYRNGKAQKMKNFFIKRFHLISTAIALAIIISISFSLYSCKNASKILESQGTFDVTRGDIIQTISVSGYVESSENNNYSPSISGEVLHTLKKGDTFSKGDVLIEIDNRQQQLLIEQAEENLNSSKKSLDTARINYQQALDSNHIALQLAQTSTQQAEIAAQNAFTALENANNVAEKSRESARVSLENSKKLLEEAQSGPMMTDTSLAQYEANVESALASYESAKAQGTSSSRTAEGSYQQATVNQSATYWSNLSSTKSTEAQINLTSKNIALVESQVKLSEINLELAKLNSDSNIVYAPYDGMVLSSSYEEGQYASPGMNSISVISSDLVIKADINEIDVVNIKAGQDADISLDAYYENKIKGKIIEISPIPTNIGGVVSFEITAKPETRNGTGLLYGLSASLEITTTSLEDVLYIPLQSIYEENGKTYVDFVTTDKNVEKREVTAGVSNYDFIEIKSGLDEGDVILVSPINYTPAGNFNF